MAHHDGFPGLFALAARTVRTHARKLAASRAVPGMEEEDYEQELFLDLVRRLPSYDPSRSSLTTFIGCLVRHQTARLFETGRTIARRREAAMKSFEEPLADGEAWRTFGDSIGEELALAAYLEGLGADQLDLRHDLSRFLNSLPPGLTACFPVLSGHTLREVARTAGLHHSSVAERLARLRARALQAGLQIYLDGHQTKRPRRR